MGLQGQVRLLVSPLTSKAAGGNSGVQPVQPSSSRVAFLVNCTVAAAGSLALSVEWSDDGGTTFYAGDPADGFTAIAAAGKVVKSFEVKGTSYRLVWTIVTGPFTFSVDELGIG